MTKIAISVPEELFTRLEAARRRGRLSRSAAFQVAAERWLSALERTEEVRRYVRGYERLPEQAEELGAWEGVEAWGAWEPK